MTLKLNLILVIEQEKDYSNYCKGLIAVTTASGGTTSYQV